MQVVKNSSISKIQPCKNIMTVSNVKYEHICNITAGVNWDFLSSLIELGVTSHTNEIWEWLKWRLYKTNVLVMMVTVILTCYMMLEGTNRKWLIEELQPRPLLPAPCQRASGSLFTPKVQQRGLRAPLWPSQHKALRGAHSFWLTGPSSLSSHPWWFTLFSGEKPTWMFFFFYPTWFFASTTARHYPSV